MLLGVEQAVEVEARRPLVLGLEDGLGVVQADPPDVLGELAVGSRQVLRGVRSVDGMPNVLISSMSTLFEIIGISSPRLRPVRLRRVRQSPSALALCSP